MHDKCMTNACGGPCLDAGPYQRTQTTICHAFEKQERRAERWFETQGGPAYNFTGKAGETHRVFVFSADTHGIESDDKPWINPAAADKDLSLTHSRRR